MKISTLSIPRLKEILSAYQPLRVGVIGDFALDAYWYVDMAQSKLSRETPLFNRPIIQETYSLGGAANVAWNLADLGIGEVVAFAIVGDDWRATLLRYYLEKARIRLDGVVSSPTGSTLLFAKILLAAHGLQQEDARLDFVNAQIVPEEIETLLLSKLDAYVSQLDAMVIADYQPGGTITEKVIERLNNLAHKYPHKLFVVDSRDRINYYQGMVLKPNEFEAEQAFVSGRNSSQSSSTDLTSAGTALQKRVRKPVFVTMGERGCLVFDEKGVAQLSAVHIPPPIDPVGAGDTFLAALSASLTAGASAYEAGQIASLAAAVTVRKLKVTGTATPSEIIALREVVSQEDTSS